jgi:hypothetical protein
LCPLLRVLCVTVCSGWYCAAEPVLQRSLLALRRAAAAEAPHTLPVEVPQDAQPLLHQVEVLQLDEQPAGETRVASVLRCAAPRGVDFAEPTNCVLQMFRRDWFIEKYQNKINEILQLTPPHNDLEYFMNWNFAAWNDAEIKVGLGEGLFTHKEIGEHGSMNFDSVREVRTVVDSVVVAMTPAPAPAPAPPLRC